MGQNSSSLFERIPSEVLTDIVVLAVDPLGPPKAFLTSLSICRELSWHLDRNAVGSRLFRCLFDTSSPERTLAEDAMRPRNLFKQLQSYCVTLQVIRRCDIYASDVVDHLWNAYFMLIENDEHNAAQLIHWADVRTFADRFVRERLHEGRVDPKQWPLDTVANSLALWVAWLSMDHGESRVSPSATSIDHRHDFFTEAVLNEAPQRRQQMMELVRPYVVNHVRYPVYHVPDNHYNVPIDRMYMGQFPFTASTAHGPYPPYRDAHTVTVKRTHFSLQLALMPPPISLAARLLYFSRSEATPIVPQDNVPEDRAQALALGQNWVRPTRVDLLEFNAQRAARPPLLVPPDTDSLLSFQHDNCLHRLMHCRDPFSGTTLAPYTLGSLTGDFSGRMLVRPRTPQRAHVDSSTTIRSPTRARIRRC